MSRIYENGYLVEYPNELAYAGMPAIVRVSQLDTAYIGVGITIKVGENYYTETRTPYNGEVVFDISRYMQTAFIGRNLSPRYGGLRYEQGMVSNTQADVSVVVSLTDTLGKVVNVHSFDVNALVGYMPIGRANGGVRNRKWFVNFPQTFDFYGEEHIDIWLDDTRVTIERSGIAIKQISVELSPYWGNATEGAQSAVLEALNAVYLNGDVLNRDAQNIYRLTIDRCTKGVYLRWLDNFGQWCYYLFRTTGRNYATKEVQSWQDGVLRNDLQPENDVYTGHSSQQLSQQESISLGAKLVDAETFDFLLTLTNSPIVEVLTNATEYQANNNTTPLWERVSVVGGSYARTGAPLQDFAVSIVRNAQTSQML
ncbi:MAG: hypothetical protein IIV16_03330 [Alistipes sp.]|nr:hypothetical protein [Alistipes sp.]